MISTLVEFSISHQGVSMLDQGEQLVSSYLRFIQHCDFVETNVYTGEKQGEIDVIGLNTKMSEVYICEVAIHLTTGLKYSDNKDDNIQKLTDKFSRGIEYARNYYKEYEQHFMLWSPIVKESQMQHLTEMQKNIRKKYSIHIECIVNERFQVCLEELRGYAKCESKALRQYSLMRLMQIEESLCKHVSKLTNSSINSPFNRLAKPAIDIQNEKKTDVGYSEFWAPIRNGKYGQLFKGKPVPIKDEGWITKSINNIGVLLFITNQQCYVQLYFRGENALERRDSVMELFPVSDYTYNYRNSPKQIKVQFPVLNKGKNDREDWDEIREKLVNMGTDIYNKIKEADL